MLLVVEGILHGEDSSPGMAVEDEVVEAETAADLFDLFEITRECPERGVVGMVGVVAAQLIVVIHLDAGVGEERFHGFEVLMAEGGGTMQEEHFDGPAAHALRPYLVLAADDGEHADARGPNARRVELVDALRGGLRGLPGCVTVRAWLHCMRR